MTEQKARSLDRRRAAVLFADLSGFSARVGSLGAERAHRQVGECLERMGAVVVRHGGYVHQYEGDCLMALFGTPVAIERASRAAVSAALEIQRCVASHGLRASRGRRADVRSCGRSPSSRGFARGGQPVGSGHAGLRWAREEDSHTTSMVSKCDGWDARRDGRPTAPPCETIRDDWEGAASPPGPRSARWAKGKAHLWIVAGRPSSLRT